MMWCQPSPGLLRDPFKEDRDEIQQKTFPYRVNGSSGCTGTFRFCAEHGIEPVERDKPDTHAAIWSATLLVYLGGAKLHVRPKPAEAGRSYS